MPKGPFKPIPLTCQVKVAGHSTIDNLPVVNVFHAIVPSAPTAAELAIIAGTFGSFYTSASGDLSSAIVIDTIEVTDLNSSSGAQVTVPFTGTQPSGADNIGPGVSLVANLFTAKRGRSFTGRVYLPASGSGYTSSTGAFSSAYQTNFVTALSTLNTDLQALSPASGLLVASRKLQESTVVTSASVRAQSARIRRRQFGH